eukprot:720237-Rhodomonas_salina.3
MTRSLPALRVGLRCTDCCSLVGPDVACGASRFRRRQPTFCAQPSSQPGTGFPSKSQVEFVAWVCGWCAMPGTDGVCGGAEDEVSLRQALRVLTDSLVASARSCSATRLACSGPDVGSRCCQVDMQSRVQPTT